MRRATEKSYRMKIAQTTRYAMKRLPKFCISFVTSPEFLFAVLSDDLGAFLGGKIQRFHFMAQSLEAIPLANQNDHQHGHHAAAKEKHFGHGGIQARICPAENHRLGVLGPPDANGKIIERDSEKHENTEDCRYYRSPLWVIYQSSQDQVRDVQQPYDQR